MLTENGVVNPDAAKARPYVLAKTFAGGSRHSSGKIKACRNQVAFFVFCQLLQLSLFSRVFLL